jgi:hypothetical protein
MWKALIDQVDKNDQALTDLLGFALEKLLLASSTVQPKNLKVEQTLALLGCRACLTISPVSWYAPALVGGHMATAVRMSDDREEVAVSYPSEPILAIASRSYMNGAKDFMEVGLVQLKSYLASGAVQTGHRGELIVRLLNLLAIDRCMSLAVGVKKVKLREFLMAFSRDEAKVDLRKITGLDPPTKADLEMFGQTGILYDDSISDSQLYVEERVLDGFVCFTHFIHLGRNGVLSPDLLRYAYRRTAAIVMESGRRGIDWVIPVELADDETFVGLCGQDKNRMNETLESLARGTEEATHHKVTAQYFLTPKEQKLFEDERWSLNWPAVLFSVDARKVACGFADRTTRRRLRSSDGQIVTDPFPCLIFTGLSYHGLMSNAANERLEELRNFVVEVPRAYEKNVPLTYGVHRDDESMDTD